MPQDPLDKTAYIDKHTKILNDLTVNNQTVILNERIVGSISKFVMFDDNEITSWIDKQYWGKGIATATLKIFLTIENSRPIFWKSNF